MNICYAFLTVLIVAAQSQSNLDSAMPSVASNDAAKASTAPVASPVEMITYRLSGERALHPTRIGDDGERTYLEWSDEQALPAVFAINAFGEEEMADGYMRDGIYTIDRVYERLVFRIGRNTAKAFRNER